MTGLRFYTGHDALHQTGRAGQPLRWYQRRRRPRLRPPSPPPDRFVTIVAMCRRFMFSVANAPISIAADATLAAARRKYGAGPAIPAAAAWVCGGGGGSPDGRGL